MRGLLNLFVSAALALSFYGASWAYGSENSLARLLLTAALAAHLLMLLSAITAPGDRIFGLTSGLYHSFLFIGPALLQSAAGDFPFFHKTYPAAYVTAAALITLVYSVLLVGAYLATPMAVRSDRPVASPAPSSNRYYAVSLLCALLAIAGLAILGPDVFITKRGDITNLIFDPSPLNLIVNNLARSGAFLCFLVALVKFARARTALSLVWALAAAAVYLFFNNPLNVSRFQLFGSLLCIAYVLSRSQTWQFKWALTVGYILSTLTAFPLLNNLSRGQRGAALLTDPFQYDVSTVDFDAFQSTINVVAMVDAGGISWGKRLLSALLVFVPRGVWPDKSQPTGADAAHFVGYRVLNISSPAPSELFADFSWVGVVIGALLLGWVLARGDRAAGRASASQGAPFRIFLGACAAFSAILFRGPLLGVIAQASLALLLAFAVSRLLDARSGRTAATARTNAFAGRPARDRVGRAPAPVNPPTAIP